MNQNKKHQSPDRQLQGNRQGNENNDCITHQVADNRYQSADKCDCNNERRLRQANSEHKNRSQYRVDQRDGDLRAHDRGKAAVKTAEPRRDFIAGNGIKIVFHCMGAPVGV